MVNVDSCRVDTGVYMFSTVYRFGTSVILQSMLAAIMLILVSTCSVLCAGVEPMSF